MTPKVGQYLYASCSAMSYGPILSVGLDANDHPVISISITASQLDDFLTCDRFDDATPPLTTLSGEGTMTLSDIQYKSFENEFIALNMPGDGCYRCTELFSLREEP